MINPQGASGCGTLPSVRSMCCVLGPHPPGTGNSTFKMNLWIMRVSFTRFRPVRSNDPWRIIERRVDSALPSSVRGIAKVIEEKRHSVEYRLFCGGGDLRGTVCTIFLSSKLQCWIQVLADRLLLVDKGFVVDDFRQPHADPWYPAPYHLRYKQNL